MLKLAYKSAHHIVFCGDPNQSITRFAGAGDAIYDELQLTCDKELPLRLSFRLPPNITQKANQIHPSAKLRSSKTAKGEDKSVPFDESSRIGDVFLAADVSNGTSMYNKVEVYSENDLLDESLAMKAINQKDTILVSPKGSDFENCGNLLTGPCGTIQYAVDQAQDQKATVYATPGTPIHCHQSR
jgi:hypothetical protein